MLSYIIPTRNRPERLRQTLAALASLSADAHDAIGGAEVIVIDNASAPRPILPKSLGNGLPLRAVHLDKNRGAAARNEGARTARGEWLVMLDDDSHPLDTTHIEVLLETPDDIAAIGADIALPDGSRERGGLPEVFVGCGVALRRDAFLQVGGYDATFEYYAEEYDVCAKLLFKGWHITHDRRFRVLHEKTQHGRNFNAIVHRLVRNNVWVMQRYAPENMRHSEIAHIIERYAGIAMRENAARGFALGMSDLGNSLVHQPRTPMSDELFDRFTGAAHVRKALEDAEIDGDTRVTIVDGGKNEHVIRRTVIEMGARIVMDERDADVLLIGTLSPGPMLDAWERQRGYERVMLPWAMQHGDSDGNGGAKVQQSRHVRISP